MEEVWRDVRWIMDALQYARYKQPTGGISVSWIIDFSKEVMPDKPPSTSSQPDFMPSPMPSPERCRKHSGQKDVWFVWFQKIFFVHEQFFLYQKIWYCGIIVLIYKFLSFLAPFRFCWTLRWGRLLWSFPHYRQWLWLQSCPEPPRAGPVAPFTSLVLCAPGAPWFPAHRRGRLRRRNASQRGWTWRGSSAGFHTRRPPSIRAAAREGRREVWRRWRLSMWRRKAKGGSGAVWQWLHLAQQADWAFAHHREEAGLLREDQQSGVPFRPPAALLLPHYLPFTFHLTAAKMAPALISRPLLFRWALPVTASAGTHIIRRQRHSETRLTITCCSQERLSCHTQSLPAVPHRSAKGDQRQGIDSFSRDFHSERLVFVLANTNISSYISALCNSRHIRTGDGPAGGAGDERRVPAHDGKQWKRWRTGAVCLLQSWTAEALRPRAGCGRQREVVTGRLLSPGASKPLAEGQTVCSY